MLASTPSRMDAQSAGSLDMKDGKARFSQRHLLLSMAEEAGVFKGESVLIVAPPGSGKTWLGLEVAAGRALMGEKAAYLAPLRALAAECYRKIKRKGLSASLTTGDYHLPLGEEWSVLVSTFERFDSLTRRSEVSVGTVVVDEVHTLGDGRRGARLEGLLVRMRESNVQLVALTATLGNAEEIAEWLGLKLLKLKPARRQPKVIVCQDKNRAVLELAERAVNERKQLLVFVSTRRSAESLAKIIAKKIGLDFTCSSLKCLPDELGELAASGVGYHHAGLTRKTRAAIEELFDQGVIRVLVATTTLSAGVNIPASIVAVRDLRVFDGERSTYLDANVLHQILGRAGRRGGKGESFILCQSHAEKGAVLRRYFNGSAPVTSSAVSQIGRFLDEQVLVEVYRRGEASLRDLQEFLERTLWWKQRIREKLRLKPEKVVVEGQVAKGFFKASKAIISFDPLRFSCSCSLPQPCPHVKALASEVGVDLSNPLKPVLERLARQGFLEQTTGKTYFLSAFGALTVKLYLTCDVALLLRRRVRMCRSERDVKLLAMEALEECAGRKLGKPHEENADLPWMIYCIGEVARLEGAVNAMLASQTLRGEVERWSQLREDAK